MRTPRRSISRAFGEAGATPAHHVSAFGTDAVGQKFIIQRDSYGKLQAHVGTITHDAHMLDGNLLDDEEMVEIIQVIDTESGDHLPGTVVVRGRHGEVCYLVVYAADQGKRARLEEYGGENGDRNSGEAVVVKEILLPDRSAATVKRVDGIPQCIEKFGIQARVTKGSLDAPQIMFRCMQDGQWRDMRDNEFNFQKKQELAVREELDKQYIRRALIDGFIDGFIDGHSRNLDEIQLDEVREEVEHMLQGKNIGMHRKILYRRDGYVATVWYQHGEAKPPKDIVADDGKVQGRQINIPMRDGMSLTVLLTIANPQFCILPEGVGFHGDQSKEAMRQRPLYMQSGLNFYSRINRGCVWCK